MDRRRATEPKRWGASLHHEIRGGASLHHEKFRVAQLRGGRRRGTGGGGELSRMGRRRAAELKGVGASLHHKKRGRFSAPRKVSAILTWVAGELNHSLSRNSKWEFAVRGATMWVQYKAPKHQN